jgi:hypothetical protein
MNEWRRLCGEFRLPIPARRASRFTVRSARSIHPSPVDGDEDRPDGSFTDIEVERSGGARGERDRDVLAALAHDPQRPMPTVHVEIGDVGAERFGDAQPVQRQQRDQRVIAGGAETGLHEQGAEFVAIQPERA